MKKCTACEVENDLVEECLVDENGNGLPLCQNCKAELIRLSLGTVKPMDDYAPIQEEHSRRKIGRAHV
jgi:hypothetical protein